MDMHGILEKENIGKRLNLELIAMFSRSTLKETQKPLLCNGDVCMP